MKLDNTKESSCRTLQNYECFVFHAMLTTSGVQFISVPINDGVNCI